MTMRHTTRAVAVVATIIASLACGGAGLAEPPSTSSTPETPATAPAPAPPRAAPPSQSGNPDVSRIPFLGDPVSTSELTVAGWTCGANEIGNMDCSQPLSVDGAPDAEVSLLLTFDGNVAAVNGMATGDSLAPDAARKIATQIIRIATVHGWRCSLPGVTGSLTTCDKAGKVIQITEYSGDNYAMASVRDPAAEGQTAD